MHVRGAQCHRTLLPAVREGRATARAVPPGTLSSAIARSALLGLAPDPKSKTNLETKIMHQGMAEARHTALDSKDMQLICEVFGVYLTVLVSWCQSSGKMKVFAGNTDWQVKCRSPIVGYAGGILG